MTNTGYNYMSLTYLTINKQTNNIIFFVTIWRFNFVYIFISYIKKHAPSPNISVNMSISKKILW